MAQGKRPANPEPPSGRKKANPTSRVVDLTRSDDDCDDFIDFAWIPAGDSEVETQSLPPQVSGSEKASRFVVSSSILCIRLTTLLSTANYYVGEPARDIARLLQQTAESKDSAFPRSLDGHSTVNQPFPTSSSGEPAHMTGTEWQ